MSPRSVTNWLDQHPPVMRDLVCEVGLIPRLLMLMLWMCCLSFAQEEKNELGLLLGAEFIQGPQPLLTGS